VNSELHSLKHAKPVSVHVQVDKDDFLNYTSGKSTIARFVV